MEVPGYTLCYLGLEKFGGRISFMLMTGLSGISLLILPWLLNSKNTLPVRNFTRSYDNLIASVGKLKRMFFRLNGSNIIVKKLVRQAPEAATT